MRYKTINKDKEAFKPFEQNTKKVQIIGTYGAIYSAVIQLDRNAEERQLEAIEHMKEFIQNVREELHEMRAELFEAKMDIAAVVVQPRVNPFFIIILFCPRTLSVGKSARVTRKRAKKALLKGNIYCYLTVLYRYVV